MISKRVVRGETNRFGELQIYSLLRAQSSVDFENTRWKCATYGVKWEAEQCLFRRNLQPFADDHAQSFAEIIRPFASLPVLNAFIPLKLIQVNLLSQDESGNTIRCANKLMGAHECEVGDMLQQWHRGVSILPNFSKTVVVCNFYIGIALSSALAFSFLTISFIFNVIVHFRF